MVEHLMECHGGEHMVESTLAGSRWWSTWWGAHGGEHMVEHHGGEHMVEHHGREHLVEQAAHLMMARKQSG